MSRIWTLILWKPILSELFPNRPTAFTEFNLCGFNLRLIETTLPLPCHPFPSHLPFPFLVPHIQAWRHWSIKKRGREGGTQSFQCPKKGTGEQGVEPKKAISIDMASGLRIRAWWWWSAWMRERWRRQW